MTIETKGLIELKDVKAIVFECAECNSKIVLALGNFKRIPTSCPDCNENWLIEGSGELTDLNTFLRHIERAGKATSGPFKLKFEIEGLGKPV